MQRKPEWFKRRLPGGAPFRDVIATLARHSLHSVCDEARCPNRGECFSKRTATFLILGDACTRNCRFCAVNHGVPLPPDPDEPEHLAHAVADLGLMHVVVTSVTRDDLPDGGGAHFAESIGSVRRLNPETAVEALVPDFKGELPPLETVIAANPAVLGHNIETVPRLYPLVRTGSDYRRSLALLRNVHELAPEIITKSGLMLGLGETEDEILDVFEALLASGCRILTLGQYLRPSRNHVPIARFLHPDEFESLRETALGMGFGAVASGPEVRSSYKASEMTGILSKQ